MRRVTLICALLAAFAISVPLSFAALSGSPDGAPAPVLRQADVPDANVEELPAWDPDSPQQLVRIDGRLYQADSDLYYPVVADRITVRLAEGVESWEALVDEALRKAPDTFAALRNLEPLGTNRLRIVDLKTPEGADLPALAELAFRTGLVRYAELSTRGTYTLIPDDPRFDEQWALRNTGQTGGTPDADIDADEAWDLSTGDPDTVVAVIDSGTDIDHEDLAPTTWNNEDEVPGNGVDDDGNGYVDDFEGWDFDNDNNDPRTTYFHGTHCTGIVNAATGNAIGISGIAGGNGGGGARAMALGIGETAPNGNVLDEAILYAADNGAAVITLSLSVGETQAINDALDYAYNEKDVFIDCAAGNSGSSVSYPARRDEVMSVASTDHNDNKSGFSNPGPENEVAAPGSDVLSTQLDNGYGTSSGTSFAAPQVAGVAALVRSLNPGLTAPDVRQILIDSAEDVGPAGFDEGTGHGRINAVIALELAGSSDGRVRLDASRYSCNDEIGITVSDTDLAGDGTTVVTIWSDTEPEGEPVTLEESNDGSGVFRGAIATAAGSATPDGVLQTADSETITVEYVDADDGQGGTNVSKTDTAQTDCRAPLISDVGSKDIDTSSATITWTTDEGSTSLVRYGEVTPPTSEESRSGLVTQHEVTLTGLEECTIYKYEVESADSLANVAVDDNGGRYYSFETYGEFPGVGVIPCSRGEATLDDTDYACSDTVKARVTDIDLNTDPEVVETVTVLMTSTSEPDGENLVLTEVDADGSRFEGTIALDTSAPTSGDGLLAIAPGDLISVTYEDQDDGEGNPRTSTDTAEADCIAPEIGEVEVTNLSNTRARITWTTDEPATSRVEYGPTADLGSVEQSSELVTDHSVVISGFEACERVFFRVSSADRHGDERMIDAGGEPFAFNLDRIGGLLFYDGFESPAAWETEGEWEYAAPAGLGSDGGDPEEAYSGDVVLGVDVSGQGTFTGDYEPNVAISATTPPLDATEARNLELIYRRNLGVRGDDSARVVTITDGISGVWESRNTVTDGDWTVARYDISEAGDGHPALRVSFRLESDGGSQSFGWNLDEVIIKDATQPDYLACGDCGGAPTFAGLQSVSDPDACGPGGLELDWDPATAWGTGSGGTYEVHRGSSPDFVPDASNRVVTGLTETRWTDPDAPVDSEVWYIVRARSNESCSGGEGLADGNTVRVAGTETTSRPTPGSPGDSLRVSRVGGAHVRLTWQPAVDATSYVVRRSESADFSDPQDIGRTADTLFEDEDAQTNAKLYLYKVYAANPCGEETP